MINFLVKFLALAALVELFSCSTTFLDAKKQSFYVKTPKSLDYKLHGKKDDHRFGFEVEENNQFHHTKTAEDGVRIGCFSHVLNDKTYLTHYVADAKGYRLVPYDKIITVYPKDDAKPRRASFAQAFNKEELMRANIHYIFPNGCQAPNIKIPLLEIKDESVEIPAEAKITEHIVETDAKLGTEPKEVTAIGAFARTELEVKKDEQEDKKQDGNKQQAEEETFCDDCCDNTQPQIILAESSSCCKPISKLLIPIELKELEKISVKEIAELFKETDPVKLILKLLRVLEKCQK